MEKKNVIVFILSFIILALAGLVYISQKGASAPFVVPQPAPITPTPSNQIPKDWKTYRNETMKFEIKYPPDWKVDEIKNTVDEKKGGVIIYKGKKLELGTSAGVIDEYGKTLNLSIFDDGNICSECSRFHKEELKETTINGYHAIQPVQADYISWVYSPSKDRVLEMTYIDSSSSTANERQSDELFQKILSTFNFLQ